MCTKMKAGVPDMQLQGDQLDKQVGRQIQSPAIRKSEGAEIYFAGLLDK